MTNNIFDNVRQDLEDKEEQSLAKYAIKSKYAKRLYMDNYEPCQRRTEFERDKDRIIYSLAFKRLMEKTQVYMTNQGDHYTNRLSHTLEVTQISRSVATSLGLNAYLTEAIALGHDLGHTPFGHAGEQELHLLLTPENVIKMLDDDTAEIYEKEAFGFKHNLQSVRLAVSLENIYGTVGLDLTNFTL